MFSILGTIFKESAITRGALYGIFFGSKKHKNLLFLLLGESGSKTLTDLTIEGWLNVLHRYPASLLEHNYSKIIFSIKCKYKYIIYQYLENVTFLDIIVLWKITLNSIYQAILRIS